MYNANAAACNNLGNLTFVTDCTGYSPMTYSNFVWNFTPVKTIDDEIREALGELRKAIIDFRAEYLDKPKKKSRKH